MRQKEQTSDPLETQENAAGHGHTQATKHKETFSHGMVRGSIVIFGRRGCRLKPGGTSFKCMTPNEVLKIKTDCELNQKVKALISWLIL